MSRIHSFVCIFVFFLDLATAASYPTATYKLVKDYGAGTSSFYNNFNFFTGSDPTNGYVNYLSQSDAFNEGLAYNYEGVSWFGANYWTTETYRDSIRLQSKATYTEVLIIANFVWVPGSVCGSWPAFWTTNLNNWPNGGEIDILEGVNNQQVNHYSFHTGGTCSQSGQTQTGLIGTTDCDIYDSSDNSGCGGYATSSSTYGDGMNAAGGGVYALDWRKAGIRIWYFPPNKIPRDITSGKPTTSGWGTPMADLPSKSCNIVNNFYGHSIIFDVTFCGDWAGADYPDSGCPGTCGDFVQNNSSAFYPSGWGITSLKVYKSSLS